MPPECPAQIDRIREVMTTAFDWKALGWTSPDGPKEGEPSPRDGRPLRKYTGTVNERTVTVYSSR